MVVDSENNRLYHKQLRSKIKEISENKEKSPTFHPLLSVVFVSVNCWWMAAALSIGLVPAGMYWAESHAQ